MRRLTVGLGMLLVAGSPLSAGARLTVQAPTVMLAPGHLVVETLVEPDAANTSIEVTAASADFYRSSEMALAGDASPRKNVFEFKNLPVGTYEIRARLLDAAGDQRAIAVRTLDVISDPRRH